MIPVTIERRISAVQGTESWQSLQVDWPMLGQHVLDAGGLVVEGDVRAAFVLHELDLCFRPGRGDDFQALALGQLDYEPEGLRR